MMLGVNRARQGKKGAVGKKKGGQSRTRWGPRKGKGAKKGEKSKKGKGKGKGRQERFYLAKDAKTGEQKVKKAEDDEDDWPDEFEGFYDKDGVWRDIIDDAEVSGVYDSRGRFVKDPPGMIGEYWNDIVT